MLGVFQQQVLRLVFQKLVNWIVCDKCRDGCQKLRVLHGKHGDSFVKSLWNICGKYEDGKVKKLVWTLQEDL